MKRTVVLIFGVLLFSATQVVGQISDLTYAASEGQTKTVAQLLKSGTNPNALNQKGITPLYSASEKGHLQIVKMLVDQYGANVNFQIPVSSSCCHGWTALMIAAAEGHKDVVQYLLSKGANPNLRNQYGRTALMFPVNYGYLEIAKLLIDKGADPNAVDENGRGMVIVATEKNHPGVLKLLLTAGAKADVKNSEGKTALQIAETRGHSEIVQILKKP